MPFVRATRRKSYLRACLAGVSGGGKTYTALRWLFHLVRRGLAKRVAVIHSEGSKINDYANLVVDGVAWEFDVLELASYAPLAYVAAIAEAIRAGYDAILIDSLSHEWQGSGGALELVDSSGKNKYTDGWKLVTPMHTRFLDAMLKAPAHMIATCRVKQEYTMQSETKGDRTIAVPTRVGMKPIQRDGAEYEWSVFITLDKSHVATVEKTIYSSIDGRTFILPDDSLFGPVSDWIGTGDPIDPERYKLPGGGDDSRAHALIERALAAGLDLNGERDWIRKKYGTDAFIDLTADQLAVYERRVSQTETTAQARRADQQAAAAHGSTLAEAGATMPAVVGAPIRGDEDAGPDWTMKIRPLFVELSYFKGLSADQQTAALTQLCVKYGGPGVISPKLLPIDAAEKLGKFLAEKLAEAQAAAGRTVTVTENGDPAPTSVDPSPKT